MTENFMTAAQALEAEVIGALPSHFHNAWIELAENDDDMGVWLSEQIADLQNELLSTIAARVIETVRRSALIELGLPLTPNDENLPNCSALDEVQER